MEVVNSVLVQGKGTGMAGSLRMCMIFENHLTRLTSMIRKEEFLDKRLNF